MSFSSVLTAIGRLITRQGGLMAPSHSSLRVLMVLPTWPLRGWASFIVAIVVGGIGSLVVFLVVGLRHQIGTRPRTNADRPSDTHDHR